MTDFNEYQVDHEVSDQIITLLQKCAGEDPSHRLIAYERMKEILDYEIKQAREQEQERRYQVTIKKNQSGPHCPVCIGTLPCDCVEMLENIASSGG